MTETKKLQSALHAIDNWIAYRRFRKRISGVAVGIIQNDQVVIAKGYGYQDVHSKKPVTETTLFRIASISKTFTATAIMQLAESGKINIEQPVHKILPWFKSNKDNNLENITIRHILVHGAGITRDGTTEHWTNDNFPALEQIIEQVQKGITVFTPLERWKYSNFGYSILGEVIAKASDLSYEEYLKQNIFCKIDLRQTFVDRIPESDSDLLATAYGRDTPGRNREIFKSTTTQGMTSAAGLISNVSDLCKYMQAHFPDNEILLSPLSKKDMQMVHLEDDAKTNKYGFGFQVWKVGDRTINGHGGGFQGYSTSIGFDPKKKIGIVVLTNVIDGSPKEFLNGIFRILNYFDKKRDNASSANSLMADNFLEKCTGIFTNRWGEVIVSKLGNKLFCFDANQDNPTETIAMLKPHTNDTFIIDSKDGEENVGESARFEFDEFNKVSSFYYGSLKFTPFTIPFDE